MSNSIVGISGLAGSGKDTAASFLVRNHGYTRISMADPLKDCVSAVFGWDRELLDGTTPTSRQWREVPDQRWGITPRQALQMVGTDLFRNHYRKDIWVKAVSARMGLHTPTGKARGSAGATDYVIPDIRFPNEIDMIRELGGRMLYIQRGELPEWWGLALQGDHSTLQSFYPDIHPSEYEWVGHGELLSDTWITNDGTLEELEQTVSRFTRMHTE